MTNIPKALKIQAFGYKPKMYVLLLSPFENLAPSAYQC